VTGERTTGDISGRGPALGTAGRRGSAREGERLRERERTPAPSDGEGALRALFDSSLDAILVATDDREYVDANPAACELLGVARDGLLGSRIEDFVPEGQEDAARAAWGEFLERGRMEGEIALRRADGAVRVAEFRARARFMPGQHLSILRDVTERKRAQEALRASEERYRTLVENVSDYAIFMIDAVGVVTEWTEGARRVKGYAAEDVIGRHLSMFYAPEELAAGDPERELVQAAREGRSEREGWRVRKGGERIFVNEIATAVRDAEGRLVGFTKISRDLTERRRAEEALRESEERLRLAADAAGLGRWEFFPQIGKLVGDDAFNGHHGAPPGAELGMEGHLEAMHPDDCEAVRRHVVRALEERGGYEAEYRVVLSDGSPRWILSRGRFVSGGGGTAPDRMVGVTLDVTEGRELEKERERARFRAVSARAEAAERERISRELHDRVAHSMGVAHQSLELHTALAEVAPDRAAEKLELAKETTRRALDQTRSLAAELKRMQEEEEELKDGLRAAFESLLVTSVPYGVSVDLSFFGDESLVPNAVGVQVYLVIREAVRNAVRHSGCERIGIPLRVEEDEVVGVVEDNGEGFDPEAVGKISPSWGVGLRSMAERAEMLGGELRVSSTPGAGTRVEVRVPLDGRRP
jgi:PAS domain S-box-containing protein